MSPPSPPASDNRPSTRPLLDKLAVKADSRVAVIGEFPDWFRVLLLQRVAFIAEDAPSEPVEMIFLLADSHDELVALHDLRQRIEQNGAIWVVSRKGQGGDLA